MKTFRIKQIGKHITVYQMLTDPSVHIGYSYDPEFDQKHLFHIGILFWSLEVNF